jgi:hypothetical protein
MFLLFLIFFKIMKAAGEESTINNISQYPGLMRHLNLKLILPPDSNVTCYCSYGFYVKLCVCMSSTPKLGKKVETSAQM